MPAPILTWKKVLKQPGRFTLQVLKAFQKNQGLLLSGALAYYILLSIIPLLTFLLLSASRCRRRDRSHGDIAQVHRSHHTREFTSNS